MSEHWFENGFVIRGSYAGWNDCLAVKEQSQTWSSTAGVQGVWILHPKIIMGLTVKPESSQMQNVGDKGKT